jgi:hypothetical protein
MLVRWSLASQHRKSGGLIHRSNSGFPAGLSLLEGRSWAVALDGCPVFLALSGFSPGAGTSLALNKKAIIIPF